MSTSLEASLNFHQHPDMSVSISDLGTRNFEVKLDSHPTADLSLEFDPTPDMDTNPDSTLNLPEVNLSEIQLGARYERKVPRIHRHTQDRIKRNQNQINKQPLNSLPDSSKKFQKNQTDSIPTSNPEDSYETPELKSEGFPEVEIQTEVTLGVGENCLAENLSNTDSEVGGNFQVKIKRLSKLYFGGTALWWFILAATTGITAVMMAIWALVEWSNLAKKPSYGW